MCHLLPCFKGPTFFLRIIKYQLRISNCESESDEDICPTDYQVPVEDCESESDDWFFSEEHSVHVHPEKISAQTKTSGLSDSEIFEE